MSLKYTTITAVPSPFHAHMYTIHIMFYVSYNGKGQLCIFIEHKNFLWTNLFCPLCMTKKLCQELYFYHGCSEWTNQIAQTEITYQPTSTYKLSGYQLSTLLPMPMAEVPSYIHAYLPWEEWLTTSCNASSAVSRKGRFVCQSIDTTPAPLIIS